MRSDLAMNLDTIVAPITGTPPAAVAWIRLSGRDAWAIAAQVFSPWPSPVVPRHASYGHWIHGDDGLALPFAEGQSYTGEESVEISLHGSVASIQLALEQCQAAGARMARPGEFTERAFLHGRIDLTQAEAVRETIEAVTLSQLREANRGRGPVVRDEINALRNVATGIRAAIEASVDFAEEVGDLDGERTRRSLEELRVRIESQIKKAEIGRIIRQGLRIAIVGHPNAGKSSLLNALLGEERAIVTDVPGTTRDYLEERADFEGNLVVLIDTAGLRETDDPVESIGVQRSRAIAAHADVVWYVYDAREDRPEIPAFGRPTQAIPNKVDLVPGREGVSALTGAGLDALIAWTRPYFDHGTGPSVSPRGKELLGRARDQVEQCLHHLASDAPDDLLSVLVQEVIDTLGEITGETASEDMVERIFHDFCVGK